MRVTLAGSAGFCFGVQRAVEEVYRQLDLGKGPVFTYGPIIHNDQVVEELSARGVRVIGSEEELAGLDEGTIIIRSHGVSRSVQEAMERQGVRVVDATCPFVKKIHRIAERETEEGHALLIAGNPDHPEVEGIVGWARGPACVVRSAADLDSLHLPADAEAHLVAQTTFNKRKFQDIVDIFREKVYHSSVTNTVCNATEERQTEARRIARQVDAMIVIGGKHSSNTQKLYEICSEECKNTYFIETLVDLDIQPFQYFSHVGITAGASTPKSIIEEVLEYVRTKL